MQRAVLCLLSSLVLVAPAWAQQIRYLQGHEDSVYAVAVSPDGKFILSGSFDNTARLWDRHTGQTVRVLRDHQRLVLTVAFSAQGGLMATGGLDNTVWVYEVPHSSPVAEVPLSAAPVALAALPGGKQFLVADATGRIFLWDVASGKSVRSFSGNAAPVQALSTSANGAFFLAADQTGVIRGWSPNQSQPQGAVGVLDCRFLLIRADNKTVLAVDSQGVVRQLSWPPIPGKPLPALPAAATALALSPNGALVAVGTQSGTLLVFNRAEGKLLRQINTPEPITALTFLRDNASVATGHPSGAIRLWKAADGSLLAEILGHHGPVQALAPHPDNQRFVSAGADGRVAFWSRSVSPGRSGKLPQPPLLAAWKPDLSELAVALADKTVVLLRAQDLSAQGKLQGLSAPAVALSWRNDSTQVLVATQDGKLHGFQRSDGKLLWSQEVGQKIQQVALTAQGPQAAVVWGQNKLRLMEAKPQGKVLLEVQLPGPALALGFSADGKHLISITSGAVQWWSAGKNQPVRELKLPRVAQAASLLPGGKLLAVVLQDGVAQIYQLADGKRTQEFKLTRAVSRVFLTPDGQWLLALQGDQAWLWHVPSARLAQRFALGPKVVAAGLLPGSAGVLSLAGTGQAQLHPKAFVAQLPAQAGPVRNLVLHSSGTQAFLIGPDGKLHAWNIGQPEKAKPVRTFSGSQGSLAAVALSPNARYLIAASGKKLWIWNPANGQLEGQLELPQAVHTLSFASDNRRVLVGTAQGAYVIDVQAKLVLESWPQPTSSVLAVFVPDGSTVLAAGKQAWKWTPGVSRAVRTRAASLVAAAGLPNRNQFALSFADGQVELWDAGRLALVRRFQGHSGVANRLAFSGNGQLLVATTGQALFVWRINGQPLAQTTLPVKAQALVVDGQGQKILLGGVNGRIYNFSYREQGNQRRLELGQQLTGHTKPVQALLLLEDGRSLFSASEDQSLRRWVAASAVARHVLRGHRDRVYAVAFSPDGKRLASAAADNTVRLWDTNTGKNYATCSGHNGPVYAVVFLPSAEQLLSCSADRTVRLWNAASGKLVRQWTQGIDEPLYSLDVAQDGKRFLGAGLGKRWLLWSVEQDAPLRSTAGHTDYIYQVRYNPQGTRVATLGYSGQLIIWDLEGKPLYKQKLPVKAAFALAYTPDGSELVLGTSDARVLIFTLPSQAR